MSTNSLPFESVVSLGVRCTRQSLGNGDKVYWFRSNQEGNEWQKNHSKLTIEELEKFHSGEFDTFLLEEVSKF